MDALTRDDVTAVLVTRCAADGEEVAADLLDFFPVTYIWDNSELIDLGAFGRYAAIFLNSTGPVIYVQDDDCMVSDADKQRLIDNYEPGVITALMPPERTDYTDTVLIGWGAIFDRDLPYQAFSRWNAAGHDMCSQEFRVVGADFVFPMITPWKRLDAYHQDLPRAHDTTVRTYWTWPNYASVKERYLREGRAIRDNGGRHR